MCVCVELYIHITFCQMDVFTNCRCLGKNSLHNLTSQEKFYCQNETFSSLWTRQEETMRFFLYTIVIMEVKREPVRGENLFKIFGRMK